MVKQDHIILNMLNHRESGRTASFRPFTKLVPAPGAGAGTHGGSVALAFAQNSNYAYYPRKLTAAQSTAYAGGPGNWPKAAVDCEPFAAPGWCLFQAQSPDNIDATGNTYGAPLVFDRPVKAVFSADGGTAYVLNCGPECGGTASSVS